MDKVDLTLEELDRMVLFCAMECEVQQSGEMSVYYMLDAYLWAHNRGGVKLPTDQDIVVLGSLVEPEKNAKGYRKIPVEVSGNVIGSDNIASQMFMLSTLTLNDITPEEFYQEFESIHPFIDGNGRVGAILYNWYRGSLHNPERPPFYVGGW
jgi:hypothetical protein